MQTKLVIQHLSEITYFHMHDIREYIKNIFDVEYSIPGLQKWLHRNRFSYKQFKGVPHKYEQRKQNIFVEKLKATVTSDEPILFMDGCHTSNSGDENQLWLDTQRC